MNPAGVVILVAGVWVLCQVFGGNALERLGIVKPVDDAGGGAGAVAGAVGGAAAGAVPGGANNPPFGNLRDFLPQQGGGVIRRLG